MEGEELDIEDKNYVTGLKDGIRKYAWWKDGEQYVGSCGTTLKQALEGVDHEFSSQHNYTKSHKLWCAHCFKDLGPLDERNTYLSSLQASHSCKVGGVREGE